MSESPGSHPLVTVRTPPAVRALLAEWRAQGLSVGLVATMGALHEGHLDLVRAAKARCDRTIATIFVNPAQFAPHEDLARYPRREAEDAALLAATGCDGLYLPEVATMYPPGHATRVRVSGVSEPLEGKFRPHFFEGVATIVAKLLIQIAPDVAFFGEKDWQQLQVVTRLASDLDLPVTIVGVPTRREADGLAMSSRNAYLDPARRAAAPALKRALDRLASAAARGEDLGAAEAQARADLLAAGFEAVDYCTVLDAETLGPYAPDRPGRALAAAWLGGTRLIDNRAT
jgi:pantoate--beta-alanine ligase